MPRARLAFKKLRVLGLDCEQLYNVGFGIGFKEGFWTFCGCLIHPTSWLWLKTLTMDVAQFLKLLSCAPSIISTFLVV